MARLLDVDGTLMTTAMTRGVEAERAVSLAVSLEEIEDPSVLLDYYFGRGERLVVMELPGLTPPLTVEGSLETWWIGGARVWHVYIDRPLVTLGPVGSAHPEPAVGAPLTVPRSPLLARANRI
jgi:hypothetical protein